MKTRILLFCLLTVLFSLLSCNHEIAGGPYLEAHVVSVVSKDVLQIHFIDHVPDGLQQMESARLIGVETPSLRSPENQYATDEPYAAEAADKTKSFCGESLTIFFDKKIGYLRDAEGSLYVYLYQDAAGSESINERLIREGYARYWSLGLELEGGKAERFLAAQEQAQFDGVGMWRE